MTSGKRGVTVSPAVRFAGRRDLIRAVSPAILPLLALSLLALTQHGQAGELSNVRVVRTVGAASDLHSAAPLYSEIHCVSDDARAREIFYRNGEQQLIAHKILSYTTGPTTPSYVQHNFYDRQSIAVKLQQDDIAMTVTSEGGAGLEKTITTRRDSSVPLVIDAGFDAFVTGNWDTLVDGQSKRFQFPFASRERLVDLRITSADCSYDTETDQCFQLELDNWLLSKLVAPIELGYDAKLKRLSRYRGLSNIGDSQGDGQVVDIRYSYHDLPPQACTVSDLV